MSDPEFSPPVDTSTVLPTVSVIVPNFNHGQYLPRCLTALLEQSVLPMEIIVVDDASTDNSIQVIEEFARRHSRIRFRCNAQNLGAVRSANIGLEMSRGDYVFFAAADDYVLPGFMEKSLALLRLHPQAALCCTIGDWHEVATGLNWHVGVGMGKEPCYIPPSQVAELERQGRLFVASHSTIMRKAPLMEMGGLIDNLRWHNDWFAIHVVSFRYGICFVPEPLARLHIFSKSYYASGRRSPEHEQVLQRMLELLIKPEYQDVEPMIRRSGALFLFGTPMLRLILLKSAYRRFLTPVFLRKNLWHSAKITLKQFTPAFVGNWYFRLAGYRARSRGSAHLSIAP